MQDVEDFMRGYFAAKRAEIQRELASRRPFRSKFFTVDCVWDSRVDALKEHDAERIESIEILGDEAQIITSSTEINIRLRYTLVESGTSWLIRTIQPPCYRCHGRTNDLTCELCRGTGWLRL